MGAITSRQRCHHMTYESLRVAQGPGHETEGPQARNAIMAYIDGRIGARRLIRDSTDLEVCRISHLLPFSPAMH